MKPILDDICLARKTLGHYLGSRMYAIVGGGVLVLLGPERETVDIDFVVPRGERASVRLILSREADCFHVEPKTNHTTYKSDPPVNIEILALPGIFKMPFDASTPTITIDDAKVLKSTLILNAKCDSILGRATDDKKISDANDIMYLLHWCIKEDGRTHDCTPTAAEVPNASKEFVRWCIGIYQQENLWMSAGYDMKTGRFP